jgi:hypothetical protein
MPWPGQALICVTMQASTELQWLCLVVPFKLDWTWTLYERWTGYLRLDALD